MSETLQVNRPTEAGLAWIEEQHGARNARNEARAEAAQQLHASEAAEPQLAGEQASGVPREDSFGDNRLLKQSLKMRTSQGVGSGEGAPFGNGGGTTETAAKPDTSGGSYSFNGSELSHAQDEVGKVPLSISRGNDKRRPIKGYQPPVQEGLVLESAEAKAAKGAEDDALQLANSRRGEGKLIDDAPAEPTPKERTREAWDAFAAAVSAPPYGDGKRSGNP